MMQLPCSMIVSPTLTQALMLLLVSLTKRTIYAKLWILFTETEEQSEHRREDERMPEVST